MGYTTPPTFVDTDVLYAADLNSYLKGNLDWVETNRPRFSLTLNGGSYSHTQANSGNWQNPGWSATEPVDTGNMHASTNAYVTVPSDGAGFWLFGANATWDGNTTGSRAIAITSAAHSSGSLAGTLYAKVQETAINSGPSLVIVGGTYLAANATLYVNYFQNSGGSAGSRTVTDGFFWGVRICG